MSRERVNPAEPAPGWLTNNAELAQIAWFE
jgi:hypothetical protein